MQRRSLILVSLLLAAFVINLDITIVNVALPTLVRELHASNSQLQWVVDAYNLLFAALLLASGSLSDRYGRKGFLLAGLGVFGVASIAGGLTDTAGQLIVARCFMGFGAAMIFPTTLSLISNVYTERAERAKAIGLVDQVVDPENLDAAINELANTLAANAPLTLKATKQMIEQLAAPPSDVMAGGKWYQEIFRSRDFQEGLDAFLTKRKPEFTGE